MSRRPFYAEYVNHCLRFYCRNTEKFDSFRTEVDRVNWEICASLMKDVYTPDERDILISVYSKNDTMVENVNNAAKEHDVCQDLVWNLIVDISRRVAQHRGLI